MTLGGGPFRVDYTDSMMAAPQVHAYSAALVEWMKSFRAAPPPEAASIFHHATRTDDLADIVALTTRWRNNYRCLVVVGAGGSGLSGHALAMLKYGTQPVGDVHRLLTLDNLDADLFTQRLDTLDFNACCFLLASKSGGTAEIFAQGALLLQAMAERGIKEIEKRVVAIALPGDNPLRKLAARYNIPVWDHDENLCGRFSLLSSVGLIPAAFVGLDIQAVRQGAAEVAVHGFSEAANGAALHMMHMQAGRGISVLMPYSERLFGLARWWRQSWAESLGKQGKGSTPLAALGTADQHSQLQLFLDGKDDKFHTLIVYDCQGIGPTLPHSDKTLGDLQFAQQQATIKTLAHHQRPVRVFKVDAIDERIFGALVMYFTLEIIFTAALLEVNPFDQPAVEESKRLAQEYLRYTPSMVENSSKAVG